jgi:hypothetical protein
MAAEAKIIDEEERDRLVLQMKSCYFPERSHRALQSLCPALASYFRDSVLPDVKRDDALELLIAMKSARVTQRDVTAQSTSMDR